MILLILRGKPIPFSAPVKGSGRFFNPKYQVLKNYQLEIKSQYLGEILEEAVAVEYIYCFEIPKSFSKKKTHSALSGEIFPCTRPDLDNLDKLVSDSLIGTVLKDDSQIVKKNVRKIYGNHAYTQVKVFKINGENL